MRKKRSFISFDYDNDCDLKVLLIGQSKNPDSPFSITDMSIKHKIEKDWKENARKRIKGCDVVIIICGMETHLATGVSTEIKIAQEEGIPYFLLWGRKDKKCTKPKGVTKEDKIYKWTWNNLKLLIGGTR